MISHVDGTADQFAALGICSGNNQVFGAHDIPLKSRSVQAVDVFANGYEDFARKMTTLLTPMQLVLEVDGCCTVLGKELCELHYCCEAAVPGGKLALRGSAETYFSSPSITISYYRS